MANVWSIIATLLDEIELCIQWVFCRKFNCRQLLFKAFFDIIKCFDRNQIKFSKNFENPYFYLKNRYFRENPYSLKNPYMYSRLAMNFLNHFECFCDIKTNFPAKTNRCMLFNCFFHYDLWQGQNRQITSHREYVPHCEWFELKLGMGGEESLLTNFPNFMGDHTASIMFLQHCRKTYRTELVLEFQIF